MSVAEAPVGAAAAPSEAPLPHLGTGVRAAYGFGSIAYGIAGTVLSGTVLQLYFNQVIGLPAAWVGAAIMVYLRFSSACARVALA